MIPFVIDGKAVEVKEGTTVLEAALDAGIEIPRLCYNESVKPYGACRLCLVEIVKNGKSRITTSCTYPAMKGIEVFTNNEKVLRNRRVIMELTLAMCPEDKHLQAMAHGMGLEQVRFKKEDKDCILCGLCTRVCEEVVGANAIQFAFRGDLKEVSAPFREEALNCIACGACAIVCPVSAIKIKESADERTITRWNRNLKMKKCKICGNYFAPWFQLEKFKERANLPKNFFDTCYTCRS